MEDHQQPTEVISARVSKKNGFLKKSLWVIFALLILAGAWQGLKLINPKATGPRINPLSLIPQNTLYLIESDKPYQVWNELTQTDVWDLLEKDPDWKEAGIALNEISANLEDFDQALDMLANRSVFISFHPIRRAQTDMLFILDLEGLGVLKTWMTNVNEVTKRKFHDKIIYEQFDSSTKETFYFTFEDNYLIGSKTHTLIEASINQKEIAFLPRSLDFLDVQKKAKGEGLLRIYANYQALYQHFGNLIGKEIASEFSTRIPFLFSGMYLDVQQQALEINGYTTFNDSLSTYLNIFQRAKPGESDIAEILPNQTSAYISFGFDSFQKFYLALHQQLAKDPVSGEDFVTYTHKTEKFLDISLEEDLANWIADEIASVQMELNEKSETALVIKAKSKSDAKEKTDYLSRQIKRKTPVRFKTVTYKAHDINYMAVKGMFNLLFGNLFKKFDRPYYTVIDQFVVFSNSPGVLRQMIDYYLNDRTLSKTESYQRFMADFGSTHSAHLYLQLELLKESKDGILDAETVEYLKTKSNFLQHFPQLGFKITSDDQMFETKLLLSVKKAESDLAIFDFDESLFNYDSLFQIDPGEQIVVTEIEIEDLSAKKQSEDFEEGKPKYEVEIKNGLKHGNYFEYHPSGELKIRGRYKNDLKEGTWKYYDINGKLSNKERYRKGTLIE